MERTSGTGESRGLLVLGGAVLVLPALACWFGFGERFRVPKMLAGEGLAALGLLAMSFAGRRRARWSDCAWDLPVAAALGSLMYMEGHSLTGWRDVARLAALSSAFIVFRATRDPWRMVPVVGLAVAGNAGLAILQRAGLGLWETAREGRHAVYGTFGNPNLLGEWLAVAIPMVAVAAAQSRRPAARAAGWAVVALALTAMLATGARAAALGLAMASPVLALALSPWGAGPVAGRRRIRVWSVTGAALVLAGIVFVLRAPGGGSATTDPTRATRALMRDVAGDQWAGHRWLGVGPGQYGLRFLDGAARRLEGAARPPIYAGTTMEAHSDPAQALAERGWLGALAWGAALFLALGIASARRTPGDPAGRSRFLGAVASCIVMAVIALLGFPFHVFPTAALFLWVVTVAAAEGAETGSAEAGSLPAAGLRLRALAGLLALLPACRDALAQAALAANTEPALRAALRALPTDGELRFRLALGLRAAGRIPDAEPEFAAALAGHPDPDVLFNLGRIALDRKDDALAADRFGAGLRRYPFFSAPAWADYAQALHGLHRDAEARAAAERALVIDPGLGRARALLDVLNRRDRKGASR